MRIKFTDKFFSEKLRGQSKNVPINIAKSLIKTGEATEVKSHKKKEL